MLYIIATPIGNLEDMSARAVRILGEVDIIACEDTRVTKKLLDHYRITTQMLSYHAQSDDARENEIIDMLQKGKAVALVSDAGTPTISDPGSRLVNRVRNELPNIVVSPIPGPSALMSALSISGVIGGQFTFLGFLPHKKGRQTLFQEIADADRIMVFYESPHRIMKTLQSLADVLSEDREVVIARELTKIYEEVQNGSATEILQFFEQNPEKIKGEFVVIIAP